MKQEIVETFEKINEKRKLPKEIIEKIIKEINNNFLMSIAIMIYFIVLIMGSVDLTKSVREIDFNIFSIIVLFISIFFFEYAYRKDSGKIALYGVETLVVAIITLFLSYIIFELNSLQNRYYFMIGAYIAVYYIIKAIFVCINENKKYRRENISNDIKEIVKKEKRNYETKKTIIKNYDEEDTNKKEKNIENKELSSAKKIKEKPKSKRGRPKKVQQEKLKSSVIDKNKKNKKEKVIEKQEISEKEVKEKTKAKRGRPKKVQQENLKPVIDESKIIVTEKAEVKRGRGRPRKVVS